MAILRTVGGLKEDIPTSFIFYQIIEGKTAIPNKGYESVKARRSVVRTFVQATDFLASRPDFSGVWEQIINYFDPQAKADKANQELFRELITEPRRSKGRHLDDSIIQIYSDSISRGIGMGRPKKTADMQDRHMGSCIICAEMIAGYMMEYSGISHPSQENLEIYLQQYKLIHGSSTTYRAIMEIDGMILETYDLEERNKLQLQQTELLLQYAKKEELEFKEKVGQELHDHVQGCITCFGRIAEIEATLLRNARQ